MADVYRIGVAISMTDNASAVLQTLAQKALGLNIAVRDIEGGLNRVKVAALGMAGVLGGREIIRAYGDIASAGAKLIDQQAAMANAGMTHLQIAQATAEAYRSMSVVRGPDISERLGAVRELRGIAGEGRQRSLAEVYQLLPDYLRAETVVGGRNALSLFRAVELRGDVQFGRDGSLNADRFHQGLDRALRAIQASGGTIRAQDLLGLVQQAGPMARMMSPQAFYGMMTTAVMEMGGQRAGTALTAAGRALYGGIMPERNANEMLNLGLYDPHAVRNARGLSRDQRRELEAQGYSVGRGGVVMVNRNALRGMDTLNQDGVGGWINQILAPAMHALFLRQRAQNPSETEAQFDQRELYRLFPTETFRRLASFYLTQQENVRRDQVLQNQAAGVGAYDNNLATYNTALHNFEASWESFRQTLGSPAARDGAVILTALGHGLDYLTQSLARHPTAARDLERLGLGIGVFVSAAGSAAIGLTVLRVGQLAGGVRGLLSVLAGGEVAAAAASAARLGGSTATAGSLLRLAGGITALGTALSVLPDVNRVMARHTGAPIADTVTSGIGGTLEALIGTRIARAVLSGLGHLPGHAGTLAMAGEGLLSRTSPFWAALTGAFSAAIAVERHDVFTDRLQAHLEQNNQTLRAIDSWLQSHTGFGGTFSVNIDGKQVASHVQQLSDQRSRQHATATTGQWDPLQHPPLPGASPGH